MKIQTAKWWRKDGDKVICELCPRFCTLSEGKEGFCFIRKNHKGELISTAYGKTTGLYIDPIEKKPLHHFYPSSKVLSFGTKGCNLNCNFCQNWQLSKSKTLSLNINASPLLIAETAKLKKCKSVAFTYNEPTIFIEYAIDTAKACKELDIKTVAVTAGFINEKPRKEFFSLMDAANVDLKGFNNEFYKKYTGGDLNIVLDTLKYIKHETNTWLEITNLIIPGLNDNIDEIKKMCAFIVEHLGNYVPLHFSAFHPSYKMNDISATNPLILENAYNAAKSEGILYPYTGNIIDIKGGTTYCPNCKKAIIIRNWFDVINLNIKNNKCTFCNYYIHGHFEIE